MRSPKTMSALEELGRTRLSECFFMRDFLYSEISAMTGIPNIPDDPELAVAAGKKLCQELLEPLQRRFGRIAVRSAYRSSAVNQHGNENGFNCSRNEVTYADHIWDVLDRQGRMGATACIIIPWFADAVTEGADWRALAWWIHDNLNYSSLYFFPRLTAFNIQWREEPERRIDSYIAPKGTLTKKGMPNWEGSHSDAYSWFPQDVLNRGGRA